MNLDRVSGANYVERRVLPIDISYIKDLSRCASNAVVSSLELDGCWSKAKVRGHGVVSNGSDKSDCRGDVVKGAVSRRFHVCSDYDDNGCQTKHREDSPKPVRATVRDVYVGNAAIESWCYPGLC